MIFNWKMVIFCVVSMVFSLCNGMLKNWSQTITEITKREITRRKIVLHDKAVTRGELTLKAEGPC